MPELLDGNNLMSCLGGGSRETLAAEIAELARRRRKNFILVFDGPPPSHRAKVQTLGSVTIVHAAPRSADEEILRRIQEARDPGGITVVTNDRGLGNAARAAGARILAVDRFYQDTMKRLDPTQPSGPEAPGKSNVPVNPKDWERWFSDSRNRLK